MASSINPFAVKIRTRAHLDAYWRGIRERLARGEFFRINPFLLGWNLLRDVRLCLLFNISLITSYGK